MRSEQCAGILLELGMYGVVRTKYAAGLQTAEAFGHPCDRHALRQSMQPFILRSMTTERLSASASTAIKAGLLMPHAGDTMRE
jgi:hypothetical protein